MDFKEKTKLQNPEKKPQKKDILISTYINICTLFEGRERVLMLLKEKYF